MKAVRIFEERGIDVILGIQGPADEVADCFAQDRIVPGKSMWDHEYPEILFFIAGGGQLFNPPALKGNSPQTDGELRNPSRMVSRG